MIDAVIYPGSFDPITNGHLDIILRAVKLYRRVIVVVATNHEKHSLFSLEERVRLVQDSLKEACPLEEKIEVYGLNGDLLVDFANELGVFTFLKGLRNSLDFENELPQASVNRILDSKIETIFLIASERYRYLSSSVVRAVARYHGNIDTLVPSPVRKALATKFEIKNPSC